MKVQLNTIIPLPLADRDLSQSEIWGRSLMLDLSKKYSVIAASGTGKTTLLSILYGLRSDFDGKLIYEGFESWDQLRRDRLGIVFQELNLLEHLTVLENLSLKNSLHQFFSQEELDHMMASLGILDLKHDVVGLLSRGERQRVAIMRSLCMPFKFLLLDEPFSHLDTDNTNRAIDLIQRVADQNKAGLLVANLFQDSYFQYDQTFQL